MKVYLVRHGEAVSPEVNPDKPLSPQGRNEIEKIARFLGKKSFPLSVILHSPKLRARQTAEILREYIAPNQEIEEHPHLNPNDPIEHILLRIKSEKDGVMIAGHLPFLNKLASYLLTENENDFLINFQSGTVACLKDINGKWTLDWTIGKDLID